MDVACGHYHMEHMDEKIYIGVFSGNKWPLAESIANIAHIDNYIEGKIRAD